MGSSPSMRPKNAIGKTLSSSPSFRSNPIRTITGPMIRRQKSSRQVGVCGSALEHAPVPRKTSRIRRSRSRRLKRPLAPARRSAAVCGGLGSRAKKEPKKAYRDFQAIRRKGVVQGQSRQALMSWRGPSRISTRSRSFFSVSRSSTRSRRTQLRAVRLSRLFEITKRSRLGRLHTQQVG